MESKLNKVFEAMTEYLDEAGWGSKECNFKETDTFGYRIDPITGMSHRTDFAFLIESEREIMKYLRPADK